MKTFTVRIPASLWDQAAATIDRDIRSVCSDNQMVSIFLVRAIQYAEQNPLPERETDKRQAYLSLDTTQTSSIAKRLRK